MSDRFDHRLEHTLKTKPDAPEADDGVTSVRRVELITGAGRRREWSSDDKARIIVESFRPGANVSDVARRNGLSPQQLFSWRREARAMMAERTPDAPRLGRTTLAAVSPKNSKSEPAAAPGDCAPAFTSVVIAAATPPPPPAPLVSGVIEIALGDCVVRVHGQVEPAHLTAVLRAVRRAS
jgi:transposase